MSLIHTLGFRVGLKKQNDKDYWVIVTDCGECGTSEEFWVAASHLAPLVHTLLGIMEDQGIPKAVPLAKLHKQEGLSPEEMMRKLRGGKEQ